ncbi:MAG: 1L-myo-inositol 1-phosphate cytidylyltransferase [Verrucomicrobiota bacterium]|jgi:choline kinase
MESVTEAVILMAGSGSRLAKSGMTLPKPLLPILGRPLISHTIVALEKIGVRTMHAILGANAEILLEGLQPLLPAGMILNPIVNRDWQKQNGISVLCAENKVAAPFFLTMGDHLFDQSIFQMLLNRSDRSLLNLAIDKKIDMIFDRDDAMKVQTKGGRVVRIGKELEDYDAIDTGAFLCSQEIFDHLRRSKRDEDCSLADGVRAMANESKVVAIDIGKAWWQDVDTPAMFEHAAKMLSSLNRNVDLVPGGTPLPTEDQTS